MIFWPDIGYFTKWIYSRKSLSGFRTLGRNQRATHTAEILSLRKDHADQPRIPEIAIAKNHKPLQKVSDQHASARYDYR